MCGLCQIHYEDDHEDQEGPLCGCGRFHLGAEVQAAGVLVPRKSPTCYHCFAREAKLGPCVRCQRESEGGGRAHESIPPAPVVKRR